MAEHKRMETDNVLDKKAQQLMEDRDAESRTRVFEGMLNKVFTVVLVIWAIFQVWANTFGTLGAVKLRTAHIMFLLPLALMLYPTYKKERRRRRMIPAWDVLLIAAAIASFGYILWRYDALAKTGRLNDTDVLVGVVCLLIVFEAARRASGNLAIIALIFLIPHGLPAERSSLVSPLTSSVTSNTLFRKKTFSPSTGISCSLVIAQNPSSR